MHIEPADRATTNLRGTCYPVKRARFSAPAGASWRLGCELTRVPARIPREHEVNLGAVEPPFAHLDRSPGSLIRESRIFGQIGSFSAGMARHPRRTCASPVQVGVPRETSRRAGGVGETRGERASRRFLSLREGRRERRRRRVSIVD